jgi:DNA-binding IclR family transcriptional regulator
MVDKVALVLELLSDGKWHRVEELQRRLGLDESEVHEIAEFLKEYELAKVDEENGKMKINRDFRKLSALSSV